MADKLLNDTKTYPRMAHWFNPVLLLQLLNNVVVSSMFGQYADRRRQAQIRARHALQSIAAGLKARQLTQAAQAEAMASAIHAAELQLPEAWLPYVVSR